VVVDPIEWVSLGCRLTLGEPLDVAELESVTEVPGHPSLKQGRPLSITFHDASGPIHKISLSVRVPGQPTDLLLTIHNRAIEQAKHSAEPFLK
jgi:hypothetical protein